MGTAKPDQGFGPVLANRHFRALWIAQILGNTASNGMNLILLVLVEYVTKSTVSTTGVVMAFTIPGVIFSPIAGVMVDRWPKKAILFWSNALRVLSLLLFVVLLYTTGQQSTSTLIGVYALAFIASSIGQFFGPAEASTIPMLVTQEQLLPANSLFGITLSVSQVVGFVIFGPTAVKILGFEAAFLVLAGAFALAAVSIARLPRKRLTRVQTSADAGGFGWGKASVELREGWHFVTQRRNIYIALAHFALIATLLSILQAFGPGFAELVLGLKPEDSVYIFAPAGVGMVAASFILGRFGYRISRRFLAHICLALGGGALWVISLVSMSYAASSADKSPLIGAVVASCTVFGLSVSIVNILASTNLQEFSPNYIRGRVFAVQFMLNNLLSIPPLLMAAALERRFGIPAVFGYVGVGMVIFTVLSALATWRPWSQKEKDLRKRDQEVIANETRLLFATAPIEPSYSPNHHDPAKPVQSPLDKSQTRRSK